MLNMSYEIDQSSSKRSRALAKIRSSSPQSISSVVRPLEVRQDVVQEANQISSTMYLSAEVSRLVVPISRPPPSADTDLRSPHFVLLALRDLPYSQLLAGCHAHGRAAKQICSLENPAGQFTHVLAAPQSCPLGTGVPPASDTFLFTIF